MQALPYFAIVALAALLTLPQGWRSLQPIDGWIMLVAYFAYLAQAILRQRTRGENLNWKKQEVIVAVLGVAVLGVVPTLLSQPPRISFRCWEFRS